MLLFFGGVPATILCDNLKTAVTAPSRYEPVFTELCELLSTHYSTTFSATRPYRPKDKAMVEKSVNIVYNHTYGPLRNHVFTSMASLNEAMSGMLKLLNDKPYKKTPYSHHITLKRRKSACCVSCLQPGITGHPRELYHD